MPLVTTSLALSFKKTYVPLLYTCYHYQHSIDFRINMAGNKYKRTQKFENVHILIKYTSLQCIYNMLQYKKKIEKLILLSDLFLLNKRKIRFTSTMVRKLTRANHNLNSKIPI